MSKHYPHTTAKQMKPLAMAAAALLAASAAVAHAAPIIATPGTTTGVNDVTSIGTQYDIGASTTAGTVTGVGGTGAAFLAGNSYKVNYQNSIQKVETITAGGKTYAATGFANNVVRRYTGSNNDLIWETGTKTGTTNGSTINLTGAAVSGDHEVFDYNAVNMGSDNLFSTLTTAQGGNPAGNNTNVSRLDLLFTAGIKTSANQSIFIADRGNTAKHDPFAIAAITSLGLDPDGNPYPTSFGQVLKFNAFTWGNTNLTGSPENITLRTNNDIAGDPLHPSDDEVEGVGGVAITTAELAGATGQTIYGWAVIDPNLNVSGDGSGSQLKDWTNASVYSHADFNNTGGGLDLAATPAVLFSVVAVPEPTTAALVAGTALVGLIGRRRRRTVA